MLTIVALPKPFTGNIGVIQRNAIQSWIKLKPKCEIILLGEEEGTAKVAKEFGVRHLAKVDCNEYGTPLVNSVFKIAEENASHDVLAYVNADIILMGDFTRAVQEIQKDEPFLIIGRRWDLEIDDKIDFEKSRWENILCSQLASGGQLYGHVGTDYFVFPKGLWREIPPLAIGRSLWDNWLIYGAHSLGARVIDATDVVTAVHQCHDYCHHPEGYSWIWRGPEAKRNLRLAGGYTHIYTLRDAEWALRQGPEKPILVPTNSLSRVLPAGKRIIQQIKYALFKDKLFFNMRL
ncbi:hypothetical protein ACFLRC_00340 [Candidatus Altiarchaeota archaeon]